MVILYIIYSNVLLLIYIRRPFCKIWTNLSTSYQHIHQYLTYSYPTNPALVGVVVGALVVGVLVGGILVGDTSRSLGERIT